MDLAFTMIMQNPLLGGGLYFLPWLIALATRHPRQRDVFWINLLLGWTIVGWLFALGHALDGVVKRVSALFG